MSDRIPALTIPGLKGDYVLLPEPYVLGSLHCPGCGRDSAGIEWHGWFTCDFACTTIAIVGEHPLRGEAYMRADDPMLEKAAAEPGGAE